MQEAVERPYKSAPRVNDSGVVIPEFPGQHVDAILREFKKCVVRSGVLVAAKRKEYFMPKGERRRLKSAVARRRRAKAGL